MSRHLLNGLTLEFWDYSRPLAGDRWFVLLEVRIAIPFGSTPCRRSCEGKPSGRGRWGDEIIFSQKNERNFIATVEAPEILKDMQASFWTWRPVILGIPILPPGSSEENSPKSKNCSAGSV